MGAAVADLLEDGPGRRLDLPAIGQSLALRHEFDSLGERQAVEAEKAKEQGVDAAQQRESTAAVSSGRIGGGKNLRADGKSGRPDRW